MSSWRPGRALQLLKETALAQDCTLCGAAARALVCADCAADLPRDPGMTDVRAPFAYRFPVDRMVQRFKAGGDLALGRWLAERLADHVRGDRRPDVVVAAPLGRLRLRRRGFNQSLEIARVVARAIGARCPRRALTKVRETRPQQGLGRRARQRNLRGAFTCTPALRGRRVAIVDDVVTTGATMLAITAALHRAGVRSVSWWAVARAPRRPR